jgi:hypothetical protein
MLPLVGYKPSDYGIGSFVTSYINETNEYVVVRCKSSSAYVKSKPTYKFDFVRNGENYLVYEIPNEFKESVLLFREGKYSKFPDFVKDKIKKESGLKYKQHVGERNGKPIYASSNDLLALYKDAEFKRVIEEDLNVKLDSDAELVSIPDESNFYELQLSNQLVI